ncbi:hypothetical protein [Pseudorhodoplanes sinuspersici]|uniref:hypothetical protein n=1 Tax=Pseudorhodoplanes sinuspersici TaxID=1235591 RepID=UPI0011C3D688|nr:hypothetical protein [Pseudorhodoplanes sinuspersici]
MTFGTERPQNRFGAFSEPDFIPEAKKKTPALGATEGPGQVVHPLRRGRHVRWPSVAPIIAEKRDHLVVATRGLSEKMNAFDQRVMIESRCLPIKISIKLGRVN